MALALRCAWRCGALPALSGTSAGQSSASGALRRCWLGAPGSAVRRGEARAFASVPAALVKELRTRTGASMGKCRDALAAEEEDLEKAVTWLRNRGIRSMERRTNEAAEAVLAICTPGGSTGAIVEIKAETDFVTQNALMQQLAISVACTAAGRAASAGALGEAALTAASSELAAKLSAGVSVEAALLELGSVLGERLVLGDSQQLVPAAGGVVAGYAHPKHAGAAAGTGRMAALVSLSPSPAGAEAAPGLERTAAQLARHIVALQPQFVSVESVPAEVLEKERSTMREAYMSELDEKRKKNLNEDVMKKVLDGKTKKFYADSVLLHQELTVPNANADPDAKPVSVEEWLKQEAKSLGLDAITVAEFRLVCL